MKKRLSLLTVSLVLHSFCFGANGVTLNPYTSDSIGKNASMTDAGVTLTNKERKFAEAFFNMDVNVLLNEPYKNNYESNSAIKNLGYLTKMTPSDIIFACKMDDRTFCKANRKEPFIFSGKVTKVYLEPISNTPFIIFADKNDLKKLYVTLLFNDQYKNLAYSLSKNQKVTYICKIAGENSEGAIIHD